MEYQNIIYSVEDGVATITFNRPKALNAMNAYRVQEAILAVPATGSDTDLTPEQVRQALLKANNRPNYIVQANISDLAMTEAAISVMDALNIHMFIDVGELPRASQSHTSIARARSRCANFERAWPKPFVRRGV